MEGLAHVANGGVRLEGSRSEQNAWLKAWNKRGLEIFGNERSQDFFFYWLDQQKFTKHGGCIPDFLTESGEALLGNLRLLAEAEEI